MRSLFNGFFNSVGRTLGRIIVYILIAILIMFFAKKVNASTISPFSIKNNNSTGYYDIRKYQQSDMLTIDTYGQIGSSYNVSYIQTLLNFDSNISSSSYYDLKINFTNSNFISSSVQDVKIVAYNTIPTSLTYNENLGTTLDLVYLKNNTSNTKTNSITIRFYNKLLTSYSYFQVFILQDYRVMNTGILNIDLTKVDENQAIKDLQENQNTNRDLIINNISSVIENQFQDCVISSNLLDLTKTPDEIVNSTYSYSNNTLIVNNPNSSEYSYIVYNLNVKKNTNYFVQFDNSYTTGVGIYSNNVSNYITGGKNFTFNSGNNEIINVVFYSSYSPFSNIMISEGSIKQDYSEFGSKKCTNKIDDVTNSITSEDDNTTSKKCGVICKLKGIFNGIVELPVKIANSIKNLFVPDNFDFINDFKDVMLEKLGILAEIPDMILSFFTDILNKEYVNQCFSIPKINFFGYYFWDNTNICVQDGFYYEYVKSYRWMTNIIPVFGVLAFCISTYKKFFGESDV